MHIENSTLAEQSQYRGHWYDIYVICSNTGRSLRTNTVESYASRFRLRGRPPSFSELLFCLILAIRS